MKDWKYIYKISEGMANTTNMLYTPTVNPEGNIMCMDWTFDTLYQAMNTNRTPELVEFFFKREVKYCDVFKDYKWAPKLLDIDGKKIFVEFNNYSCNSILFANNQTLTDVCPTLK